MVTGHFCALDKDRRRIAGPYRSPHQLKLAMQKRAANIRGHIDYFLYTAKDSDFDEHDICQKATNVLIGVWRSTAKSSNWRGYKWD